MAYESEEKHTKVRPEALRGHSGSAPARGDAVGDQAPACLRQRGAADRRGVVQGDPVPDRHRPEVRRQAPGVHPAVRHAWASACWSTTSTTAASPARPRARSKGRSTFRTRRSSPTAPAWRKARPASRASSPARSRASTASRSRARCSTCGRPTARASTRSSAAPPSRGCAASTTPRPTAPIRCAPSRRSATRIPMDGPVGAFFNHTNMSHMRPAHIHFAVSAPGHHYLVTHLFQKGDEYIHNDVVYGVKDAADRRVREAAARQGLERRDGRHAVLRGEVRLRAGAAAGGARGSGVATPTRRNSEKPSSECERAGAARPYHSLSLFVIAVEVRSSHETHQPPFRADHVGSLLRPAALKEARAKRAKGEIVGRRPEGDRGSRDRARHPQARRGRAASR